MASVNARTLGFQARQECLKIVITQTGEMRADESIAQSDLYDFRINHDPAIVVILLASPKNSLTALTTPDQPMQ